jgi:3-isopropylmalate/(R)-2-methylmalate dehydratase large subunit
MTVACGDSHTSTHGAFGALAFGIGTSQVRDVLASQTLLMEKLKVRRITIGGLLPPGVYAKDLALHMIRRLGAKAGVGHVHEYGGALVGSLTMDERMTLCNLAVEGGARAGYVNPDEVTANYLRNREYVVAGMTLDEEQVLWERLRSGEDAEYDDEVVFDASKVAPLVTWGTSPDQCIGVDETIPYPAMLPEDERERAAQSQEFMGLAPGQPIEGVPIDVAFIGSCTNGRLSDIEAICKLLSTGEHRVAPPVRALVVPGSRLVREAMQARGMDDFLSDRGFQVRDTGCSLCCGMNADMLVGREICASSSNRNFRGRQGSPVGRTLLMSPVMVAAAAVSGVVADSRRIFGDTPA